MEPAGFAPNQAAAQAVCEVRDVKKNALQGGLVFRLSNPAINECGLAKYGNHANMYQKIQITILTE